MCTLYRISLLFLSISLLSLNRIAAQSNKPTQQTKVSSSVTGTVFTPAAYPTSMFVNSVTARVPQQPYTDETFVNSPDRVPEEVLQTTQYTDGLGRPLQTVSRKTSPGQKDIVSPITYDEFGREQHKFLPYTSTTATGTFKTNPFTDQLNFYTGQYKTEQPAFNNERFFYSKTIFEESPLSRPEKSFAPGNSWAGSEGAGNEKAVKVQYSLTDATDAVRLWTIGIDPDISDITNIPASSGPYNEKLYKTVTTDEHAKKVVEYKDNEGKLILKKVQLEDIPSASHSGWLCTYYVYDDLNQLRFVIPPKVTEAMNSSNTWVLEQPTIKELCFRYEYDERSRMIAKKVPGAGWVYMVYDVRDRLVFTQDANLRDKSQWMYNLYDEINRPVQTGIMGYSGSREDLQTHLNNVTSGNSTIVTTDGANPQSLPGDLIINQRETGRVAYNAGTSIEFLGEFVSEQTAEYIAEITEASTDNITPINQTISLDPFPTGSSRIALTITFYDNYDFTTKSYSNINNGKLNDIGNNAWADPLPQQNNSFVKGIVTGTMVRAIEDPNDLLAGSWMETVSFYDEKARPVQVQTTNYKGGLDIATTRYDFTGKAVGTYSVMNNLSANVSDLKIKTSMDYDHAGRLLKITKRINDDDITKRIITRNSYDALGQLKNKQVGQKAAADDTPLEDQDYEYNIRGWLKGLNWDYSDASTGTKAKPNKWFAMDLGYDWGFDFSQYNGNISGMRWTTIGSGEERAYGFGYDNVNRILYGDFNQHFGSAWQKTDPVSGSNFTIDFSMQMGNAVDPTTAYDENGNIRVMQQKGLKINASPLIDDLFYSYFTNSNKLSDVKDFVPGDNKLGDFTDKNKSGPDYDYDGNGNLIIDKNKSLSGRGFNATNAAPSYNGSIQIQYNHLNLPWKIEMKDESGFAGGHITYTYDAAGNKLKKEVIETGPVINSTQIITTTTYISGAVYESKLITIRFPLGQIPDPSSYSDRLQFIGMEEGRIRFKPSTGPVAGNYNESFKYDYFLKDHLGNVRVVLTDEQQTDAYPAASMETAQLDIENTYYSNLNTRSQKPSAYPPDPTTNPNDWAAKLRGDGNKIGPGIVLKVMAGDKFNLQVNSWWKENGQSHPAGPPILNELIAALAGGIGNVSGTHGGASATELQNSGALSPGANQFLLTQPQTAGKIGAYVNWILFDEQFRFVQESSGSEQVHGSEEFYPHAFNDLPITKSGYLYVYTSNQTPDIDVFFDNLQVTHIRGPLIEETHYYPFGLTMNGISSKALAFGSPGNNYKFNKGSELQNNEFSDGSGLELYSTNFRSLDPQLGRWWQVDPKPDVIESPYASMMNNPILRNDPLGDIAHAKGDEKSIKEYLRLLALVTGNKYALNKNGDIIRTNKNLNTKTNKNVSALLSRYVEEVITNKDRIVNLNLTAASDPINKIISFDSYSEGKIDVGDLKKIKNNSLLAGQMAHPLAEYFTSQKAGKGTLDGYDDSHPVAKIVESAIVFEMNGSKPGAYGTRTASETIDLKNNRSVVTFSYGQLSFKYSTRLGEDLRGTGEIISDFK